MLKIENICTKERGTRWGSWLRNCAARRKVAGWISDGVTGIFHWHNPSARTMALGLTQPLTEMSTRNISWGKGRRWLRLTTLSPSCAHCLEIWEPQPPGTLKACPGLYVYKRAAINYSKMDTTVVTMLIRPVRIQSFYSTCRHMQHTCSIHVHDPKVSHPYDMYRCVPCRKVLHITARPIQIWCTLSMQLYYIRKIHHQSLVQYYYYLFINVPTCSGLNFWPCSGSFL